MANDNTLIVSKINEIMSTIDESPIPRVGSAGRRIIDYEIICDLLTELKTTLPENVRRANGVILEAEKIMDDAEAHARSIIDDATEHANNILTDANKNADRLERKANEYDKRRTEDADSYYANRTSDADNYYDDRVAEANAEADRIIAEAEETRIKLISEHEVTIAAQAEADELRRKTILRSDQIYMNAKRSADRVLEELMTYLEGYYDKMREDREALDVRPAATEASESQRSTRPEKRNPQYAQREEQAQDKYEDEEAEENVSILNFFKRKRRNLEETDEYNADEDD